MASPPGRMTPECAWAGRKETVGRITVYFGGLDAADQTKALYPAKGET